MEFPADTPASGLVMSEPGDGAVKQWTIAVSSQLFTAYPRDLDGTPLGPSRFAPGAPYWQALFTTGGQLATGAVMVTLIAAPPPAIRSRRAERDVPRG